MDRAMIVSGRSSDCGGREGAHDGNGQGTGRREHKDLDISEGEEHDETNYSASMWGHKRGSVEPVRTKEQKQRRDFYTNFTEKALAKTTFDSGENSAVTASESVERKQTIAWLRWVDLSHREPGASARLFCFPWAGGNSSTFDTWPERLPGVDVIPLVLPGRLTRAEEKALTTVSDIVTEAVEALCGLHLLNNGDDDIPVFFFGHELGAVVAFEVCRRVHPEFLVEALFVSGMACPQMLHEREQLSLLCQTSADGEVLHAKNAEFEQAIVRRGLAPPLLCEHKDLMEIFTPLWFADLRALDSYEYESGSILDCPIHCFGGENDVYPGGLKGWAMESSSPSCTETLYPGGGEYLRDPDNEERILRVILDSCKNATDRQTARPPEL